MRRKAVLVGCNTNSLRGAPWNDVFLLSDALVNRAHFYSDDMRLILDNDPENRPTARIIVEALQLMTINASPDDLLLFYFSGHGGYLYDDVWLSINSLGSRLAGKIDTSNELISFFN
jgi:hypothetical protein